MTDNNYRVLTVRMDKKESMNLTAAMKLLDTTVATKAVNEALKELVSSRKKIEELSKEIMQLRNERITYRDAIRDFNASVSNLQRFKL